MHGILVISHSCPRVDKYASGVSVLLMVFHFDSSLSVENSLLDFRQKSVDGLDFVQSLSRERHPIEYVVSSGVHLN